MTRISGVRGDAPKGTAKPKQLIGQAGSTLVETMVSVGLVGIMMTATVATLHGEAMDLTRASEGIANGLRKTRMDAITKGVHYRVTLTTNSWTVERLQDNDSDGVWDPDTNFAAAVTNLKPVSKISLTKSMASGVIEFDTRGVVYQTGTRMTGVGYLTLADSRRPGSQLIQIWPSGQITYQ